MNRIKLILSLIATSFSIMVNGSCYVAPILMTKYNSVVDENTAFSMNTNKVSQSLSTEPIVFRANVSAPGTLAAVIGDNLYNIDGIEVVGPMNEEDFNALWQSSFNGRLKTINLEHATIDNGKVPDYALFHIDEQVDWSTLTISTIWLEELILPEGVNEIGDFALAYTIDLKSLTLPSTVTKIGDSAFTDCISLSPSIFTLPSNLKDIGTQAFYQCQALTGEVILPTGLRSIRDAAFYQTHISEINFPESLEYIGALALWGSKLTNVSLPNDCWLEWKGGQFYNNWELTAAHLPENATFIPADVFSYCINLKEVNIPAKIERIGEFAFNSTAISDVQLPETLQRIDQDAFQGCNQLSTIVLPASLTTVETHAFNLCKGLRSVWCKAVTPPNCIPSDCEESIDPFSQIDKSIPLYVPIGTKEAYMAAPGWNLFQNIIETDNFSSASLDKITPDLPEGLKTVYDLQGRAIKNPSAGQIYIVNGQKFIAK